MANFTKLDLRIESGMPIHINKDYLQVYIDSLLLFLSDLDYMHTFSFAKSVLFNEEIKSNNNIEGINDDLRLIDKVIENAKEKITDLEPRRIINLYKGYQYILEHKEINQESLKELYAILSNGLLCKEDLERMGEYYRTAPVYILKSGRLDYTPFMGINHDKLPYFMDSLFEYINTDNEKNEMDIFIKSQIIHFYFVYIHPYFDVNGRTSRTTAMWYMLNKEVYPYIIFNRAISFKQREYSETIIKARSYGDITLFLKYLITSVEEELEKEYVIDNIKNISNQKLSKEEFQILEYFLSVNGNLTIKDVAAFYNSYNNKKKVLDIYKELLLPLLEKGILLSIGETKSYIASDIHNQNLVLNPKNIDVNPEKIKYLKLSKYTK